MNKPTMVGSVTVLLGAGLALAGNPCGVVQSLNYCNAGYAEPGHCYQPSARSDTCMGTATNFCIPTTLTCNYMMLTWDSERKECRATSAANIPYVTYTQGGPCLPDPIDPDPPGGG